MNQIIIAHVTNAPHLHPSDAIAAFVTTLVVLGLSSWLANINTK